VNRFLFLAILIVSCTATQQKKPQDDFASIPPGEYTLGSRYSVINPVHTIKSAGFRISKHEITNRQFSAFVKATGYKTTAEKYHNAMTFHPGLREFEWVEDSTANWHYPFGLKNGGIGQKMDHPVTCISFMDVQAYCKWAKVRLPTLDEWEIACRGGADGKYFFGNDSTKIVQYANIWLSRTHAEVTVQDSFLYTSPVGSFKPNPYGLYDVYGNCFEFCADKPALLQKVKNVVCARGGSWWCSKNSCNYFNSVDIGRVDRFASFSNHGFRVVMQ
jgi:sulfatase modifying factor 1